MSAPAFIGFVVISGLVLLLVTTASIIAGNSELNIAPQLFKDAGPAILLMAIAWLWLIVVSIIWELIRNTFWFVKAFLFLLLLFLATGVYSGLAESALFVISYDWPQNLNGASTLLSRLYDGFGISLTWGTPLVIGIYELRKCVAYNVTSKNFFMRCSWFVISMATALSFAFLRIIEIMNRSF
ncbi:hypothetical protein [Thiobacillus sp.]